MIFTHTACKPSGERSTQGRVIQKPRSYRFQTETSRKHGLVAKMVSNWRLPKSIFQDEFLQDSGHFMQKLKFRSWKRWVILVTRATLLASGEAVIKEVPFYKKKQKQNQKWRTTFRAQYMSYKNCKPRQHELHCPDGYLLILN